MKIKSVKFAELNVSIATIFLNTQVCSSCNDNYQQKFDEKLKEQFFNTSKFSNMITKSLCYCYKKGFILTNI